MAALQRGGLEQAAVQEGQVAESARVSRSAIHGLVEGAEAQRVEHVVLEAMPEG